jgi:membrane protease YdiL (CAAX protease family)
VSSGAWNEPLWEPAAAAATPLEAESEPQPQAPCWRCGLLAPLAVLACPHCGARVKGQTATAPTKSARAADGWQLKALLGWYAALLLTGIVHAIALQERFGDEPEVTPAISEQILGQVVAVELIDAVIVVAAVVAMRPGPSQLPLRDERRLGPWFLAAPLLVGLLAIDIAYHGALRELLRLPLEKEALGDARNWLTFVTVCVQPAVIEEVFCRGLALGTLRRVVSDRGAIALSATMFALMHVAMLLSMPYLFLLGVVLGYLRVASGTIWLPIVVHFLHNLGVLLFEWRW